MSTFFFPSSSWETAHISLNNRKCFLYENPVIFRRRYTDTELRWFCLKRNMTKKRKTQDLDESFARRKFASFLGFFSPVFTQLLLFLKTSCCRPGARSLTRQDLGAAGSSGGTRTVQLAVSVGETPGHLEGDPSLPLWSPGGPGFETHRNATVLLVTRICATGCRSRASCSCQPEPSP